jgi:hypothetical protein
MRSLDLPIQFMHEGKLYGPGKVEIEDDEKANPNGKRIADDLEGAVKRYEEAKKRGEIIAPQNPVYMQTPGPGVKPESVSAQGQSPAEVAEAQKTAADRMAKEATKAATAAEGEGEGEDKGEKKEGESGGGGGSGSEGGKAAAARAEKGRGFGGHSR